jgi:endo-1,4-beta-D-glucanase Y
LFQKILDWAKDNLKTEKIKSTLLLAIDSKGNTNWQRAAFWGNLDLFHKILDWANKNLTTEGGKCCYYPQSVTEIPPGTGQRFGGY